jgi:hypothetical protein
MAVCCPPPFASRLRFAGCKGRLMDFIDALNGPVQAAGQQTNQGHRNQPVGPSRQAAKRLGLYRCGRNERRYPQSCRDPRQSVLQCCLQRAGIKLRTLQRRTAVFQRVVLSCLGPAKWKPGLQRARFGQIALVRQPPPLCTLCAEISRWSGINRIDIQVTGPL